MQVQDDIVASLHMTRPLRLKSSFNRPNIRYEVVYRMDDSPPVAKQLAKLIQGVTGPDGAMPCCIVYTLKRETADEHAQKLRAQGVTRSLVLGCISGRCCKPGDLKIPAAITPAQCLFQCIMALKPMCDTLPDC